MKHDNKHYLKQNINVIKQTQPLALNVAEDEGSTGSNKHFRYPVSAPLVNTVATTNTDWHFI